jgi:hypothetical protein
MGTVEHYARCEQSRTKRNAGIDGAKPDPTASRQSFRDNHRSGALIAPLLAICQMLLGFGPGDAVRVNAGIARNARHRSRASFRRPQCFSLRDVSNTRST